MKNTGTGLLRAFLAVLAVSIMVLAAFALGLTVGARAAPLSGYVRPSQQPADPPAQMSPAAPTATPTVNDSPPTDASVVPAVTPAPTAIGQRTEAGPSGLDVALFEEVWKLLQDQYYGDLPEGKEVTYDAIRGLVERLGDEHTAFVDPAHAALLNADMDGQFEGIGAGVELAEGGGVRIRYLYPERPAEKAGVLVGDVIVAVDGRDVTQLNLTEAIGMIRGRKGSKVVLTIRRDDEALRDIAVTRALIEIEVVTSQSLAEGKIAYIALHEFTSVASTRLAGAMSDALAKKPKGLILDLRGNPGGLLDSAVRIGSMFVPEGNILIERTRDGTERVFRRQGRYLLGSTSLVVLVDGGSASASEIVAGAVQDAGTGVLIGEKTFGKGSVQLPNNLSDGSQLRVTIAHWFTPKDRGIHGTGLQPDILVPITEEDVTAKRDPQLDRAVDYLLGN